MQSWRRRQVLQIEAQRADVLRQFLRGFLEGHEHARLALLQSGAHQEFHGEQDFTAAGAAADQGGAPARQPTEGDFVQSAHTAGALHQGEFCLLGSVSCCHLFLR